MGSFYGNYSVGGGGGGGTSNYNDLTNKPITNLTGTDSKPIVLGGLFTGEYLIKGTYIYNESDENKKETLLLHVSVSLDEVTKERVCKFEKCEDGTWFMYVVIIRTDDYLVNKYSFSKPSNNILFVAQSELPLKGVEEVLYITEKAIYQWRDNDYILLAASEGSIDPVWGTF